MFQRHRASVASRLVVPFALVALAGCVDVPTSAEEGVGSTFEALSPFSWSTETPVGSDNQGGHYGGAVATLNGVTYMVHSGDCDDCNQLWWTKLGPNGWANDVQIPNQLASDRVSLAAFNGKLYMVHTGSTSGSTNVWLSRFDPATQQWAANYQLPYASAGTPAIAEYRGRLYIVGSMPSGTYQVWVATLDAYDTLSSQTMISQWSRSRVSLAAYNGRLYIVHRHQSTNTIVFNYFDGSSWEWNRMIPAGNGTNLEGQYPVIASHDGYLHLVFRKPGSSTVWWATFDGTAWAPAVTLGTRTSYAEPTVGQGGTGLVLTSTYRCPSGHVCFAKNMLYTSQYTSPPQPLPPIEVPPVIGFEQ